MNRVRRKTLRSSSPPRYRHLLILGFLSLALTVTGWTQGGTEEKTSAKESSWKEATRKVHAKFTGRRGTFAHFGDSITVSAAFWTSLPSERKNAPPEMEQAFKQVKDYLQPECWRDWKGSRFGNDGGQTSRWALANVEQWLKTLNPEVILLMFGTNDLHQMEVQEYRNNIRAVVQKCLDNGSVVILSTIPPRHGFNQKAERFAAALRDIARELELPLTDYYAGIRERRPNDWDGAEEKWKEYNGYEVPTLIARDGVHPSNPQRHQNDYSEQGLKTNGFTLRNYLTLTKYAEVIDALTAPPTEASADLLNQPWFPKAPPLPAPAGEVIRVSTVEQLFAAAAKVPSGGTILVTDGHYHVTGRFELKTSGVTLRSASGQREKVILDGDNMGELIALSACSGVTLADLTLRNVRWNGIKLNSETGVHNTTIHNCVLHNIWQRAIKGVGVPKERRKEMRPTGCRIQYCLFYNDRPKQFSDDPSDTAQNFGGNYIGGIDVMCAKGWTVSDNVFANINGRTGEARGAIFIWQESEDCVIERNIIINCDSGICLGNSHLGDNQVHCINFIVRNNFVTRPSDTGILADYTRNCKILNNTVYGPQNRWGRLIRLVHDNDGLVLANNLLCGPEIRNESASKIDIRGNLAKDISSALVAAERGDLHLTANATAAINQGTPLREVAEDFDQQPRENIPDLGADEFRQ